MKTQIKINLALAAGGSLVLHLLALIDPGVTWRQCLWAMGGILAMAIGNSFVQILTRNQTTHEKEHHPAPTP
jgi:hypothetical protein